MKRKMLLLTLAAMLFGWCGVLAQIDTVWVSDRLCSTENIAVSPDERFVVTWGSSGWSDPLDPLPPDTLWNGWGNPAKVFEAQTGRWLKTIFDSVNVLPKNDIIHVSFSPDSSKMLVSSNFNGTLIIDLNNKFNVIDTVNGWGKGQYSPDMSLIAVGNTYFVDANTLLPFAEFDYVSKIEHNEIGSTDPLIITHEKVGIFRKNGREYVFTYRWYTETMPHPSGGKGLAVIDLVDSTITLTPDVPYAQWYYRYGTDIYAMVENIAGENVTYSVRNQLTDSLIWKRTFDYFVKPLISVTGAYCTIGSRTFILPDTNVSCFELIRYPKELGNDLAFSDYRLGDKRLMATRPCIDYVGVPPPAIKTNIQTYPVPADNKLNINMEMKAGDYTAEIVDINGNTIRKNNLGFKQEGNETLEINTADLPSGTYMVIIRSENDVKSVKFIKR